MISSLFRQGRLEIPNQTKKLHIIFIKIIPNGNHHGSYQQIIVCVYTRDVWKVPSHVTTPVTLKVAGFF